MTRTLIPEALAGGGSLGVFLWIFPIVSSINQTLQSEWYRATVDVNGIPYITLILLSALCVLVALLFLLMGIYLSGIVVESFIFAVLKKVGLIKNG
jgi:hypothetical protein